MYKFAAAVVFVLVAGFFQGMSAETTCESHRKVSGGSGPMQWDIKCDDQGKYLPLQCTVNTPKWCTCYNKEEAITGPSRGLKTCDCPLKKDEALKMDANNPCTPKCARDGKFEKKQCCTTTQKCHCVDPITGQKTSEPTTNMNVQCQ